MDYLLLNEQYTNYILKNDRYSAYQRPDVTRESYRYSSLISV